MVEGIEGMIWWLEGSNEGGEGVASGGRIDSVCERMILSDSAFSFLRAFPVREDLWVRVGRARNLNNL